MPKTTVPRSEYARAVSLSTTNAKKALELVEAALTEDRSNQDLQFLKAQCLMELEKREEGLALFRKLSNEQPVYPSAVRDLASWLNVEDNHDQKEVIDLYRRYTELEPLDPSGHSLLGHVYLESELPALALFELRKALECDPENERYYYDLVSLLVTQNRLEEVAAVFDFGDKHQQTGQDLFGAVMSDLAIEEAYEAVQKLALKLPARMRKSVAGNIALGDSFIETGKPLRALAPLNLAIQLNKESVDAHISLASAYRALARWNAMLRVLDETLALDYKNGDARYFRACALARLGRSREAMEDLKKAIEIESYRLTVFDEDEDLKSLSALPGYKQLLAEAEKKKKEDQK